MVLSKSCDYGLRAALFLAASEREESFVSISEMAKALGLSFHFLTKILQTLTRKGLMVSTKGPHGGVRLARPADSINLMDIVIAIDGPRLLNECVLGLNGCSDQHPCPLHRQWVSIRSGITELFNQSTLKSVAQRIAEGSYRLIDLIEEPEKKV
ncbi:MAG TPA: Rrf2 family transcriptional regulator [bacterium]|nr:Rrf2 family transcriptional regulator [bacterium]HNT66642.1 Rrf2 family transcriptional regulator [bacterium]HOX87195.1 Rrf2 family transcriptional regulator [bacterium]HPG46656.1 Rrf2 family transcriptional regulator [bacterium]HPM98811.1 Rrf2 family transcriptional regulator [bacterium]